MNKIKVALFVTKNQVYNKFSGILNLFMTMAMDDRFDIRILVHNSYDKSMDNFIKKNESIVDYYSHRDVSGDSKKYDLIITIDPYFGAHDKGSGYHDWTTPILYKEYGVTGIDGSGYLYNKGVYKKAWAIITDDRNSADCISHTLNRDRLTIIPANPLFDYPAFTSKYNVGNKKVVIWSPHCSVCEDKYTRITGGKFSTFMTYKDDILKIFDKYKDQVIFVAKIHPGIYSRIKNGIKDGLIPEFSYPDYLNELAKRENVIIPASDNNYYEWFMTSDGLMNDSISFVAEYIPTQKPMLALRDETSSKYSNYAEELINKCHYNAQNVEEIDNFIQNIIINGNDDYNKVLNRFDYYKHYLGGYYANKTNSQIICDYIVEKLGKGGE